MTMTKINYRVVMSIPSIPTSRNFSELSCEAAKNSQGEVEDVDYGDDGKVSEEIVSGLTADSLLLELLSHFNDRQKIILLYQILREVGYNINYEDCAKTLSLSREHYMFLLKEIKKKARKILQP